MSTTHTPLQLETARLESGLRLEYAEYGHPDGETLVFLHGITDSWFSFSRLLPLLDATRYRAYALSQRGHGDSDRPESGYSMDDFAADVVGFMDALHVTRATLVGHSMGSVVARRVAATYPDRVDRLVLVGSSYTFLNDATREFREAVRALEDPVPAEFARTFQESTLHVPVPAEFLDRVVTETLKLPARVWQGALDAVLSLDDQAELERIAVPTLVMWGDRDEYFGREQQDRLVEAIPGAKLVVYPDTGHDLQWERPESVAYDLTAFVSGTSGPTSHWEAGPPPFQVIPARGAAPAPDDRAMATTAKTTQTRPVSDLYVESWGDGTPVVLVHGSLATGAEEWEAQRPLAAEGFRLVVADRRGYGRSPAVEGEDFLGDAEDIAELMGDGAHLVGHSYGGLGVLFAAARRPEATRSLALLEPATFALGQDQPAGRALVDAVRGMWDQESPDGEWVVGFLKAVGSDPDEFPLDFLAAALPLVPVLRRGRPIWYPELPLGELAEAPFPKLVVSGGHSAGFDAICDDLAERIGAAREVVEGAGHEIQFTGEPINEALLALWRTAG